MLNRLKHFAAEDGLMPSFHHSPARSTRREYIFWPRVPPPLAIPHSNSIRADLFSPRARNTGVLRVERNAAE